MDSEGVLVAKLDDSALQDRSAATGTLGHVDPVRKTAPGIGSTFVRSVTGSTENLRESAPALQSDLRLPTEAMEESLDLESLRGSRLPARPVELSKFGRLALANNEYLVDDDLLTNDNDDDNGVHEWKVNSARRRLVSSPNKSSFLPCYLRGFGWNNNSDTTSHTVRCTLLDSCLPRPSPEEFKNEAAMNTLRLYPHLFKVSTEINTTKFRKLLQDHPRPDFVDSVAAIFEEGAWPMANTRPSDDYPETWDNSKILPKSERERVFLEGQSQEEEDLGRFSPVFGPDLLPGQYSPPMLAAPKPRSDKLRLVTHMSAGPFCQNSMMDKSETKGARLDTLHQLMAALLQYRRKHPHKRLVLWKSDVKGAFRLIPSHPLWQLKQVVTTNYPTRSDIVAGIDRGPLKRRVDWRSCFGSCGSPRLWASAMGLVLWIALHHPKYNLLNNCHDVREPDDKVDAFVYVDDNFGYEIEGLLLYYSPYDKWMPARQVALLELWDELGIPHDAVKQVFGAELFVIGFLVDANEMTITLPTESKTELIEAVSHFITTSKRSLHEWEQLSGWISWSLNVFPLLRPALCNIYEKIASKTRRHATIYLNNSVKEDLRWYLDRTRRSSGVLAFQALDWNPYVEADYTIFCDACPSGMGFWSPDTHLGHFCKVPQESPKDTIFFWEAACVLAALEYFCADYPFPGKDKGRTRLTIFTDNLNTVHMFDRLSAKPSYNCLLKAAVDLILHHDIDLRVLHVAGKANVVADAISRQQFKTAVSLIPDLLVETFQPPQCTLGAAEK